MNSTEEPIVTRDPKTAPRRFSWATAFVLIVLIGASLGGFIFYRIETMPMRTAKQARDIFADVAHLQPRITVQNRVVFEQATKILELAVVTRDVQVERTMQEDWIGSTKALKVRGVYRVRAGFDLTKPFNVNVEGTRVLVEVPPPKILSVDQVDTELVSHESGLWNKLHPEDVAGEMKLLPGEALQQARKAKVAQEALEFMRQQLVERFGPAFQVEVKVRPSSEASVGPLN